MNLSNVNPEQKFGYKVKLNSHCDGSHHSEEEFGDWSSSYTNSFDRITKTDAYPDVLSVFDFKDGEDCFVVWAEYSTGDSFGHSERGSTETIGVFKDYETAKELVEALHNRDKHCGTEKTWSDQYSFDYTTKDGQRFSYGFVPWAGYFEHLDDLHIEKTWVR